MLACLLTWIDLQAMSAIDDDATVTQLATAWVGVALGGGKVQEASYIYQELGDKFSWTVRFRTLLLFKIVLFFRCVVAAG
jgi:hypothetical protein